MVASGRVVAKTTSPRSAAARRRISSASVASTQAFWPVTSCGMVKGEIQINIAAPPDAVWAVLADFGGLDAWMPGIETCTLEGDTRTIAMNGMEIQEQLKLSDPATRTLSYSVIAGAPMDHHLSTISIAPDGDASKATWLYEV